MPLLNVAGLRKLYGPITILDGVSFSLERGEHVALVGSNGSGKSTLLRLIAGLDQPDAGQCSLARNALVTYVAQEAEFRSGHSLWEAMTEVFAPA
ncbi:MAG TPA: ATP-binding cassette domain-containing protein, partial [Chloroflexota bacterium]|nr:ATP-binding cassette domain-containing protein [Chloroflexota bacterium]